ncbi:hypothetical protein [Succinimonas amylolytica]|uniref:hypothetical protein n=1 Tax=Succinimonas amylolytica TaxID=83769 RepID=UPI0023A7DE95
MVNTIQVFAISFVLLYFAGLGGVTFWTSGLSSSVAVSDEPEFSLRDVWDTPEHLPSDLLVMLPADFERENRERKLIRAALDRKRTVARRVSSITREEMLRSASGSQLDIRGQRVVARNNKGQKIQVKWLID